MMAVLCVDEVYLGTPRMRPGATVPAPSSQADPIQPPTHLHHLTPQRPTADTHNLAQAPKRITMAIPTPTRVRDDAGSGRTAQARLLAPIYMSFCPGQASHMHLCCLPCSEPTITWIEYSATD
jgi:hypothetical protein